MLVQREGSLQLYEGNKLAHSSYSLHRQQQLLSLIKLGYLTKSMNLNFKQQQHMMFNLYSAHSQ